MYLVSGFQFGFSLGTVGTVPASCHPNHVSALKNCNYVDDKIKKELALGRIKGPYDSFPLSNFKCSPLGVVPKKEANCFRLIHDLSFGPEDSAVNHFIPPEHATVSLETFDDVALMVVQAGKGCLLSKGDIQDAFSIVPVSPLDYHKLGFSWQGKFYFSRVLPMGSSSSVRIFETFTKSIQWILQNKFSVRFVSHIVDDFIFVGQPGTSECLDSLHKFFRLCNDIGIPIKHSKTVEPTTCAIIHGIELDTVTFEAKLPPDKIVVLTSLLNKYMTRRKITLHDLQSLLGHLNFACKAIKPGRCFLRRLYDLTRGIQHPSHKIKINKESRADLKLWASFLKDYNGRTIITDNYFISSNTLRLFTDAAGSKGFACMFKNAWAFGAFSDKMKMLHINVLELYPITLAVHLFGDQWRNRNILFLCDNLCIVHCLNKQTSTNSLIMRMIRIIVLQSLRNNFCFAAKHIFSKQNYVLDCISRFQIAEARKAAPSMNDNPEHIPPELSPENILL